MPEKVDPRRVMEYNALRTREPALVRFYCNFPDLIGEVAIKRSTARYGGHVEGTGSMFLLIVVYLGGVLTISSARGRATYWAKRCENRVRGIQAYSFTCS